MAIRNGGGGRDDQRFKAMYDKYYRRVLVFFIRAWRVSEQEAADLAQDTFLRFYATMDEYRGEAEWALLETIARSVALNRIRYHNAGKRAFKTVDIDDPANFRREPEAPAEPDYADREAAALRRKRLHDRIALLPTRQRQCVQLWLDDFKYDQIARTLNTSLDAVRSALRDARKTLQAEVGADSVFPEDER